MRRERIDTITLRSGAEHAQLAHSQRTVWRGFPGSDHLFAHVDGPRRMPSQRVIQVAPGGQLLAFAHLDRGSVRVQDKAGAGFTIERVFEGDFRFSPDGSRIAVAVQADASRPIGLRQAGVMTFDTSNGEVLDHAAITGRTRWLEWTSEGIVALARHKQRDRLVLVGRDGSFRHLHWTRSEITRFAASPGGAVIAWFERYRPPTGAGRRHKGDPHHVLYRIDAAAGAIRRVELLDVIGFTNNAEISPDGSTIAWTTSSGVMVHRDGKVTQVDKTSAHSVWFTNDSALAWAGWRAAGTWNGKVQQRIEAGKSGFATMRLRRDAPGILLVKGNALVLWRPATGAIKELATADGGGRLVSADVLDGSPVLWTQQTLSGHLPIIGKLRPRKMPRIRRK